jgi:hypothetical protein
MPAPNASDKKFWNAVASIGCIACIKDGYRNPLVSLHHIDGRTKPGAHRKVLPLCAGHHQQGTNTNSPNMIAVHPYKARFEDKYGLQEYLMVEVLQILKSKGFSYESL